MIHYMSEIRKFNSLTRVIKDFHCIYGSFIIYIEIRICSYYSYSICLNYYIFIYFLFLLFLFLYIFFIFLIIGFYI
jgi:hypothetical protein